MADEPKTEHKAEHGKKEGPLGKYKWWLLGGLAAIAAIVFLVANKKAAGSSSTTPSPASSAIDPNTGLPYASEYGAAPYGASGSDYGSSSGATGPAGPAGPAGPTGPPGPAGGTTTPGTTPGSGSVGGQNGVPLFGSNADIIGQAIANNPSFPQYVPGPGDPGYVPPPAKTAAHQQATVTHNKTITPHPAAKPKPKIAPKAPPKKPAHK